MKKTSQKGIRAVRGIIGKILAFAALFTYIAATSTDTSKTLGAIFVPIVVCIVTLARISGLNAYLLHAPWMQRFHPLYVRLRALHLRQIRGRMTPPLTDSPCVCKNCGHPFTGNFCPACGQSRRTPRLTLRDAAGNLLRSLFRVDGKFGRTVMELLYRPGYMVRDYITGHRIGYTHPLPTFFLMVMFYMIAIQLVDPKTEERKTAPTENIHTTESEDNMSHSTTSAEHTKNDKSINFSAEFNTKIDRTLSDTPYFGSVWRLLVKWGTGNRALSVLAVIPFFSLATWCLRRKTKDSARFNLMEHFVLQVYVSAQATLLSIAAILFFGIYRENALYSIPTWMAFALYCWIFRQFFVLTWWNSMWLTVKMYALTFLFILIPAVPYAILTVITSTKWAEM